MGHKHHAIVAPRIVTMGNHGGLPVPVDLREVGEQIRELKAARVRAIRGFLVYETTVTATRGRR